MVSKRKKNLIFLIGYMGAGKSTVGKKLAYALGYRFVDTDKLLEKHFKRKMSQIFKDLGEAAFRQEEERLIEKMATKFNYVISTGGGTLTRTETFYTAQRAGLLVYLKAPVETLFERAIFSQKDRPLLDMPDAEARFKKRFSVREPYYNRADLIVETSGCSSDDVVKEIAQWLRG